MANLKIQNLTRFVHMMCLVGNFAPAPVQNTPVWSGYSDSWALNSKAERQSENFKMLLCISQLSVDICGPIADRSRNFQGNLIA